MQTSPLAAFPLAKFGMYESYYYFEGGGEKTSFALQVGIGKMNYRKVESKTFFGGRGGGVEATFPGKQEMRTGHPMC